MNTKFIEQLILDVEQYGLRIHRHMTLEMAKEVIQHEKKNGIKHHWFEEELATCSSGYYEEYENQDKIPEKAALTIAKKLLKIRNTKTNQGLLPSPESALNPTPWGSMDLIKGGVESKGLTQAVKDFLHNLVGA